MGFRFLAVGLVLALTGPGFDGCQNGPPTGGAVPPGTTVSCFADADCVPMGCEDVRCIATQCMVVADIRDGDFDGHAPPPCGDDCDDADTMVFPGAPEACNMRDDDCDMIVDEDAAPGALSTLLNTASAQLSATAIGSSMVITDTGFTAGVRVRTIDFAGTVGSAVTVTTDMADASDLTTTMDGNAVAIVARTVTGGHVIEAYPVQLMGTALTIGTASTLVMLADGAEAMRVQAAPMGASFVVVWDDANGDRWVMVPSWSAPVRIAQPVSSTTPLDAASDGTTILVPSSPTVVAVLSAADGSTMGMQTFASGLASDPLTTGPTDYVVAFHDAFDHQLAHMTASMLLPMHTAPSQGSGLPLRVDETPMGVLVTRFDPTGSRGSGVGVWAVLLDESLGTLRGDFNPRSVSAGRMGTPVGFDVVASASGTAVITNFGMNGAVMTVLACEAH